MTRKIMKLLDPLTGLMECKVCGARHAASIRPGSGGKYYRGSWQCVHGCKLPPDQEVELLSGPSSVKTKTDAVRQ